MKELDVLLERWVSEAAPAASTEQLSAFEQLLTLQDPQLARYLLAGEPHPDPVTASLIERLRRP